MARNFNWRIKRQYYNQINSGEKTLEVRVGYPDIKRVQKGDTITFKDYSNIKFEVIRVTRYTDFPDMLDNEDSSKAIPGVTKYKSLEMYQEIYPEEKEALGVYVFELKKQESLKLYSLSSMINNHHAFGKYANAAYSVTDFICTDYPKHFNWYWTKEIPRLFSGTGEILICTIGSEIAGVTFLKKDSEEKKICTIYVVKKYRGRGIATVMLKQAFKYLETTKPLISIADYKVSSFSSIIKKYNWKLTQKLNKGYYNNNYCEYVYNGYLPE